MPANKLYDTWFHKIKQLCPNEPKKLLHNFTWLMIGIYLSHCVHLSWIANKIPGRAKRRSITQKLRRLLLSTIRVRKWYAPISQELINNCAKHGEIRLHVDGSKVSFHHQLLMVSLAYRRRTLPIVWTWISSSRGHSSAIKQLALLRYVRSLMPNDVSVSIAGDSEFGAVAVLEQLEKWKWAYVLRQKGSTLVDLTVHNEWQHFNELVDKPRQSRWFERVFLTKEHVHRTNLVAHWKTNEKEPWLLATNLPTKQAALRVYRRRMWIEEMFGDFKKHGFNLEDSHLKHFLRLSRLTLAVVLLYVWLVSFGSRIIKNGQRSFVDRNDRRDLGIFCIGFDM